jgi:hypothetical protein
MIMSLPCVIPPSLHIKSPQKKERRKKAIFTHAMPSIIPPQIQFQQHPISSHPIPRTTKKAIMPKKKE